MMKEKDSQRRIKMFAGYYGKGKFVRQCISSCAMLIQCFNLWWDNEVNGRKGKNIDADANLATMVEQIAWAQISTAALAELFGISEQVVAERDAVLTELLENAKQEIIHEKSGK